MISEIMTYVEAANLVTQRLSSVQCSLLNCFALLGFEIDHAAFLYDTDSFYDVAARRTGFATKTLKKAVREFLSVGVFERVHIVVAGKGLDVLKFDPEMLHGYKKLKQ